MSFPVRTLQSQVREIYSLILDAEKSENWEFGWWVLILLRRRFCSQCKAKPMNEMTLGYVVLTFACLA